MTRKGNDMEYISAAITMLIGLTITAAFNGALGISKKRKAADEQKDADRELIKKGIQAILKNDLKVRYEHWIDAGYAPDDARDDLEAEYRIYHALGKNGVMDGRRARFLDLPTERTEDA